MPARLRFNIAEAVTVPPRRYSVSRLATWPGRAACGPAPWLAAERAFHRDRRPVRPRCLDVRRPPAHPLSTDVPCVQDSEPPHFSRQALRSWLCKPRRPNRFAADVGHDLSFEHFLGEQAHRLAGRPNLRIGTPHDDDALLLSYRQHFRRPGARSLIERRVKRGGAVALRGVAHGLPRELDEVRHATPGALAPRSNANSVGTQNYARELYSPWSRPSSARRSTDANRNTTGGLDSPHNTSQLGDDQIHSQLFSRSKTQRNFAACRDERLRQRAIFSEFKASPQAS